MPPDADVGHLQSKLIAMSGKMASLAAELADQRGRIGRPEGELVVREQKARYRLRRKLKLERDTNLVDYMQGLAVEEVSESEGAL